MKHERIAVNSRVMVGKPVIKGTRLPVEQILRELSDGLTMSEVIEAHPRLTPDDIYAAIAYAADVVAHEDIFVSEPDDAISSR